VYPLHGPRLSRSIGYVGHADLDRWEAAVEVARGLHPTIVVPGHGAVSGPDLLLSRGSGRGRGVVRIGAARFSAGAGVP
jgi:hypothetical protein